MFNICLIISQAAPLISQFMLCCTAVCVFVRFVVSLFCMHSLYPSISSVSFLCAYVFLTMKSNTFSKYHKWAIYEYVELGIIWWYLIRAADDVLLCAFFVWYAYTVQWYVWKCLFINLYSKSTNDKMANTFYGCNTIAFPRKHWSHTSQTVVSAAGKVWKIVALFEKNEIQQCWC